MHTLPLYCRLAVNVHEWGGMGGVYLEFTNIVTWTECGSGCNPLEYHMSNIPKTAKLKIGSDYATIVYNQSMPNMQPSNAKYATQVALCAHLALDAQ